MRKAIIIISALIVFYILLQIYCRPHKQEFSLPAVVIQVHNGEFELIDTTTIDVAGVLRKTITGKTLYQGNINIAYFKQKGIMICPFMHTGNDQLNVKQSDYYYHYGYLFSSQRITVFRGHYKMHTTVGFDGFAFLFDLDKEEENYYILGPATNLEEGRKIYDEMKVNEMERWDWMLE